MILGFTKLIVGPLGGVDRLTGLMSVEECKHLAPVRWILPEFGWAPPNRFVRRTLSCVLLSVLITIVLMIISMATPHRENLGLLPKLGIQAAGFLMDAVQAVAVYALILFFHVHESNLRPAKPILKLVSSKASMMDFARPVRQRTPRPRLTPCARPASR